MSPHHKRSPIVRLVGWSSRRPGFALLAAAVVVCLSVLGVARMRISGSFVDMFGSKNAAAAAMARIASHYRTTDDLLLLATLPDAPATSDRSPGSADRLSTFAHRLRDAIASDAAANAMVAHVRYARDPGFEGYVRSVAIPAAPYFLSDDGFEQFLERLTPEGMRTQIQRAEALIATPGPAAAAIAKSVLKDPLRIAELADTVGSLPKGTLGSPSATPISQLQLSDDGRTLLVRISGREQVDNLTFSKQLTDRISSLAAAANTDGLRIELAGGYAIAATTSRGIRRDSIRSVVLSVVLLQALFIAFYRRPGAPLLIGAVASIGILLGFGIQGFQSPNITPLTAIIAALLAGLGIDYGIHFLSHYQTSRAAGMDSVTASEHTAAAVGVPILTNCFTSIFGFASLWPSQIRMLSDFAVLGTLGLLGSLLAVFTIMPAVLAVVDRRASSVVRPPRFGGIAARISTRPRFCITLSLLVLGIASLGSATNGFLPRVESDLSVMHPRPNAALEATNSLAARFADAGETLPVEVRSTSSEDMLLTAHDVAAALHTANPSSLGILDALGVNSLIPDPRRSIARSSRMSTLDSAAVLHTFDATIAASAFDAAAFAEYREWLETMLESQPPSIASLEPFPTLYEQFFPARTTPSTTPTETLMAIRVARPLTDRAVRDSTVAGIRQALAHIESATLSGMSTLTYDLESATRDDLPRSVAISFLLVAAWLGVVFRRPVDVALALLPLVFAVTCTIGLMTFMDLRVNAVNGVAIPLLDGIAVDAGVFLVSSARARTVAGQQTIAGFRSTAQAVLAASTTTITGFAALCVTATPAIRSLGFLGAVGVTASLCGALLLLMPILMLRSRNHPKPD